MTDEEAARAALEAHGFRPLRGVWRTLGWGRDKPEHGAIELVETLGEDPIRASFWTNFARIPALLAALDPPAKRVCPECVGKRFELGFGPVGGGVVRIGVCQTCHGTSKAYKPPAAQLLRTAALWMMHLSESYLPEGGDAAAQTAQMCAALRRLAVRLEQDPPPPDAQTEPVLPEEG